MEAHPVFEKHGSFADMKLGRGPVVHDSRTLMLARYLNLAALPPNPATLDLSKAIPSWPMYGNDRLGDCTLAALAHMIQGWTYNAGHGVTPPDAEVEEGYWLTGHPPATSGHPNGATDDGRNELEVLNWWRHPGLPNHPDVLGAFASIPADNIDLIKTSIYLFGGAYTGVALPLSAQTQQVWDVVGDGHSGDSAPGSWGGHAVDFVAYDEDGVTCVTWGGLLKITWRFVQTYFEEAYACLSNDWLKASGVDMHGFDAAALAADLAQISGKPVPPDPNPPVPTAAVVKSETISWAAVPGSKEYDLNVNGVKLGRTLTALSAKFVLKSGDRVDVIAQPSGTRQTVTVSFK